VVERDCGLDEALVEISRGARRLQPELLQHLVAFEELMVVIARDPFDKTRIDA